MDDNTTHFDPKDFRRALGMFATGVTIVTTQAGDGTPVGVTANSFNSVSLTPPLVLWSLAKSARSLQAFSDASHWNVHVLAEDQVAMSNLFARAGEDKFSGLQLDTGLNNTPLLHACSARFQCRTMFQYEGGDHIIFVGEVLGYDRSERPPLLYVTGNYALATPKAEPVSTEPLADIGAALYSEELLGYLLGRSHHQFMAGFRSRLNERQLSDGDFYVLSTLSVREPLSAEEIAQHVAYTAVNLDQHAPEALCERGLLQHSGAAGTSYTLSANGRDAVLHILAAAKDVEASVVDRLGEQEASLLRNLLKRLILATDPGLPKLWTATAPTSSH
ncbi:MULTISPECIES: flavin reductase [Comamonadaceae]|uniref:flavin reductase n=1 Tax=Comamonadaceae TaxID=80864 RepID=UPI00271703D4|nr:MULTISPECIES: flavin reductase [Comamonadaceae]MDO9143494.1 flavin reductase [Rhodoferax sp.]MDP3884977.1 flavin reductase [Hydrogenophaga sp.]